MPTNRNALIRYKTINNCLSTGRRYRIDELIDACTAALSEFSGKSGRVGERTIREDIAVMKSEKLGLNAPIAVKDSMYYYTDRSYNMGNVLFRNADVIERVIDLLSSINRKHPQAEIEDMILLLRNELSRPQVIASYIKNAAQEEFFERMDNGLPGIQGFIIADSAIPGPPARKKPSGIPSRPGRKKPNWGSIFDAIMKK